MRQFENLFKPEGLTPGVHPRKEWGDPARWQEHAIRTFPKVFEASGMSLWTPGDPVPQQGRRLLLGVATWCGYDMRLLDRISAKLLGPEPPPVVVHLFLYWESVRSNDDLHAYIPALELEKVFHTPAVGLWEDGVLVRAAEGYAGRELAARTCGVPHLPA